METKVITDNSELVLVGGWDDFRYSLTEYDRREKTYKVILLNPREAVDYARFMLKREKLCPKCGADKQVWEEVFSNDLDKGRHMCFTKDTYL